MDAKIQLKYGFKTLEPQEIANAFCGTKCLSKIGYTFFVVVLLLGEVQVEEMIIKSVDVLVGKKRALDLFLEETVFRYPQTSQVFPAVYLPQSLPCLRARKLPDLQGCVVNQSHDTS